MKNLYLLTLHIFFIFLCTALAACHEDKLEDAEALDPYVDTPANPILAAEGSLHLFTFSTFTEDIADIRNDLMVLSFDNFTPSSSNIEPDKDEDKTQNDLGWTQTSWDEDTVKWLSIESPKSSIVFNKPRQYRVLKDNELSAPTTTLNQPIYEAIDENVYERQLAATFVWDLGNYTDEAGDDVSGDKIADYESFYGFALLQHAAIWAENLYFSNGATIYGATRSVAADTLVIEGVDDNGIFTLSKTRFGTGLPDIETALQAYPQGSSRLEYRFTVDYATHSKIYMSFDTSNNKAYIYNTPSGTVYFEVPYIINTLDSYIELDTSILSESERIILGGLPTYFNPIIAGPYTDDGSFSSDITDKSYFYGKHYVKTNEINRLKLSPIFFLNPTAKSDVENAFKNWRDQRHLEEGI